MESQAHQLEHPAKADDVQSSSASSQLDAPTAIPGAEGLAEIIQAYNQVTDRLQKSHEVLQSEVVRLRQELASADAQLQRSKRLSALGEMAAGIAHEVRNPLAAIQLYTSMIAEDLQDHAGQFPEPVRCAGEIASAVRGLDGIVGDVLSFAREIDPAPEALPVEDVFERALAIHAPAILAAKVSVNKLYIDTPDLSVFADPEMLHRAILNLIRNAVDAMALVPANRELTLDARNDGGGLALTVADTGAGVDQDTVDRLFNPFFTTRATGTGLGLAIVHRIVDAHGGTIGVCDNPDSESGAAFTLCLPAATTKSKAPVQAKQPVGACA